MSAVKRRIATSTAAFSKGSKGVAITPHDTNELANVTRGIYVGVSGNIAVIMADDTVAVTLLSVPIGYLPISAKVVKSTGTTATNMIAIT